MTNKHKTRAQLVAESTQLRERVAELETAQAAHQRAESQREAALETLRDRQTHLHHAGNVAHFGRWELSLAKCKVRGSAGARMIYGLHGEEWPLAEVRGLTLPEYRAMLDAALTNLIEHQQPYEVEFRIRRPSDGQLRDIQSIAEYDAAQRIVFGAIHDIAAHQQAEAALRESEAKYRRIVETANEGIISLDSQARITFINRQTTAMLGYTPEEMIGQKFESFMTDDQLSDHAAQMEIRALGQNTVYERCFRRKDGSPHWALVSASAILNADGEFAGSFGMLADITERKRVEAQLRESNAELQTRNEELDAFAHTVAHDLINQLGIMVGYAELLVETYDTLSTETLKQTLNSISLNGRKAGNIIESLLLLASVRQQDVQVKPLDMAHIVDEAVLRLADLIQDSGADIRVPDRASWPVALGHAPWIEEVWVNYLSNALKYGGPRPCIDLSAARLPLPSAGEGQGGGFIRFSVRDYGPGLTPEQQQRLFAPFERLGQTRIKGHGLGLSIVRRITEKLGGQVGVDSAPGTLRGSTFYFTLPAASDL
jgi:PAS domain S-box-containing protein